MNEPALTGEPCTRKGLPRIARIEVFPLRVPALHTFRFAGGTLAEAGGTTPHVYVRVTDSDGAHGWGEGRPSPGWSSETLETVTTTLRHYIAPTLIGLAVHDRFGIHAALDRTLGGHPTGQPIARSAIDVAIHDLLARRANLPLRAFLGGTGDPVEIGLSYTVTHDAAEEAGRSVTEQRAAGFRHFNFKTSMRLREDIALGAAIRDAAGPDAFVWADANQSLRIDEARYLARGYEEAGIDLLEQPLFGDAQHDMPRLREATNIPLTLDEACVSATDYYRYVALGLVDFLTIKVNRSGGIWPSVHQLGVAMAARQGLVLSGLCETLLNRMAGAQLASAFGCVEPAALNGGQFLDERGLFPDKDERERDGTIYLDETPGIGVEPNPDAIAEMTVGDNL